MTVREIVFAAVLTVASGLVITGVALIWGACCVDRGGCRHRGYRVADPQRRGRCRRS